MKHLKLLFFIILIITLNSTAFALNLEVDSDLNDFAKENLLKENETQNLTNPFFLNEEEIELPEEQVELQMPTNEAITSAEERARNLEEIKSEIVINGIIMASNSRIALLISYQQEKHLLEIGDSLDGYKLTAYKNGEATFIKNGREIKIVY